MSRPNDIDRDPTQVVPPYVQAGMQFGPLPAREIVLLAPGIGITLLSLIFLRGLARWAVVGLGAVLFLVAGGTVLSTHEFTTPWDKLRTPIRRLRQRLRLPLSNEAAAADPVHGVEQLHRNGYAATTDGRLVGLVRLEGRNTDLATDDELNLVVGQLAKGIDEDIKDFDFEFYSTTTRVDPADLTDTYREAAHSEALAGEEWRDLREVLHDIDRWHQEQNAVWDPRQWRHYVKVAVEPDEITLRQQQVQSRGRRLLELAVPFVGDDTVQQRKRRKKMAEKLNRRLTTLERDVFSPLAGVEASRVSPEEFATLVADKWSGTDHAQEFTTEQACRSTAVSLWSGIDEWIDVGEVPDDADADIDAADTGPTTAEQDDTASAEAVTTDGGAAQTTHEETDTARSTDDSSSDEAGLFRGVLDLLDSLIGSEDEQTEGLHHQKPGLHSRLAPPDYDTDTGFVRVGDQFCRTFWIASWPAQPESRLLRDLYTMQGVDLDVSIKCRPRDRKDTIHELEHLIAEIDAEAIDREEDTDVSSVAITDDLEAYMTMYKLLQQSNTQPWDINAYVTVRVGNEAALQLAEERIGELLDDQASTLETYKRRALDRKADEVQTTLESKPADLMALAPGANQKLLFESCGPVGHDVYDANSTRNRYRPTLGGTIAATFPPGSKYINDPDGVEYGRAVQHGTVLKADPFDRGGAPHQLTIGPSGSGKTYSVGKRALRWWAADPGERTLILCDTMGGFTDLVEVCNGEHIVVDGEETINPLEVEEPAEEVLDSTDDSIDPFRMAVDSAREFISRIVGISGPDRDQYNSTIEECVENTYTRHGITPDDISVDEQPTMEDFLETLTEMVQNPSAFTISSTEREREKKAENAAELLDYLSGFKEHGKYNHLRGETDVSITPGEVTYLDLQQIEGQGDADKSAMLHLMLTQAYQAVKRAPDKTMFVIDEAHYLLHSDEMVDWLQRAARHWRHHDAMMWFVSQDPDEFVDNANEAADNHRETITSQCSTVEFFHTPKLDREIAREGFGMTPNEIRFVTQEATPGEADVGYTEALVDFRDVEGWIRSLIEASPLEDEIHSDDEDG